MAVDTPPRPPAAPPHDPPPPSPSRSLIHCRTDLGGGAFRVGRLTCGPDILGYGSGGTLVFAGHLAGAGGGGGGGHHRGGAVR